MKAILYITAKIILALLAICVVLILTRLGLAASQAERDNGKVTQPASINLGSTNSLTILPLFEEEAAREDLHSEHGISYLLMTDRQTIMMDVGNNMQMISPAPLQENMRKLGISMADVDVLAISHNHPDHVGGMQWWQKSTFSVGSEQADLGDISLFTPIAMSYPGSKPEIALGPQKLAEGAATLGRQPFVQPFPFLLWQPLEWEQSLVVNVEGEGLVIITACGHPGLEKIVARAESLFNLPVVGVVGGLHYEGLSEKEVRPHIDFLQTRKLKLVALSPHDNGPLIIETFRQAFPDAYQYLKVGSEIHFP